MCSAYVRAWIPDEEEPWEPREFEDETMYFDYATSSYGATIPGKTKLLTYDEAVADAARAAREHAAKFPALADQIVVQVWYWCHGDEPGRVINWRALNA